MYLELAACRPPKMPQIGTPWVLAHPLTQRIKKEGWRVELDGYELDTQWHRGLDQHGDVVVLGIISPTSTSMQLEILVAMLVAK